MDVEQKGSRALFLLSPAVVALVGEAVTTGATGGRCGPEVSDRQQSRSLFTCVHPTRRVMSTLCLTPSIHCLRWEDVSCIVGVSLACVSIGHLLPGRAGSGRSSTRLLQVEKSLCQTGSINRDTTSSIPVIFCPPFARDHTHHSEPEGNGESHLRFCFVLLREVIQSCINPPVLRRTALECSARWQQLQYTVLGR